MIEYRKGNLLDVTEGIIIHGCNCQGVMGSGVAKAVRDKFPEAYKTYRAEHEYYTLVLGEIVWWCNDDYTLWIANALTQDEYGTDRRYVNYAAIAKVFTEIFRQVRISKRPVHFPKIGSGLGGGSWEIIEQIINDCDPHNKIKKICWEL